MATRELHENISCSRALNSLNSLVLHRTLQFRYLMSSESNKQLTAKRCISISRPVSSVSINFCTKIVTHFKKVVSGRQHEPKISMSDIEKAA